VFCGFGGVCREKDEMSVLQYCLDKEGDMVRVGERVAKTGGDYTFEGRVVVIFHKLGAADAIRVVVEGDEGILLIMTPKQIRRVSTYQAYEEVLPRTSCPACNHRIEP
jgi:hypothetical protein